MQPIQNKKSLEKEIKNMENKLDPDKAKYAKIDLHVHPFFSSYGFYKIVEKAMEKDIKILGLEHYNNNIFPEIAERATSLKEYEVEYDNALISKSSLMKISKNGKSIYFPKSTELTTKEKIHLLVIGNYNGINAGESLDKIVQSSLEKGCLVMLDHPFVDSEKTHKPITKKTRNYLNTVAKKYGNSIFIEKNGYCRDDIWEILSRLYYISDAFSERNNLKRGINKSANRLAEEFARDHNINIIADTDLHARSEHSLKYLAESNMEIPEKNLDFSSIDKLTKTMKESINNRNHRNNTNYPSIKHLTFEYVLPNVLARYISILRPRG